MRKCNIGLVILALALVASVAEANVQTELTAAADQGQVAFVLVTDHGATGLDQARTLAQATADQVGNATVVELDRADPANTDLVAKWRLAGAPVPLILVTATNGVLAGGLPAAQANTEVLLAMIPSPKKAAVIQALQAGKAVFITASNDKMAARSAATASCSAACGKMKDQGVSIEIDLNDPQEADFLSQLKVDRAATEPVTLVINAQGQLTQTYTGSVEVASLVAAATKQASSCCSSGSGASCGTTK